MAPYPMFYLPTWWLPPLTMYAVARNPTADFAASWRAALHTVDADIPDAQLEPLESRVSASLFQRPDVRLAHPTSHAGPRCARGRW